MCHLGGSETAGQSRDPCEMDGVENTGFAKTFATGCQLQFHHRLDLQPSKQFRSDGSWKQSDPAPKSCFCYLALFTMDMVMRQENKASLCKQNIWGACLINDSTASIKKGQSPLGTLRCGAILLCFRSQGGIFCFLCGAQGEEFAEVH